MIIGKGGIEKIIELKLLNSEKTQLKNLLNLSKEITLQIDGNLEIFKFLYPEINIIHSENINNKKFDYQIPICSLPHILGFAELKNLNLKKFNIKEDIVENNKFKLDNNKLNIGLSLFGGNPRKYRSIPIRNFEELLLNKRYLLGQKGKKNYFILIVE